MNTGSCTGLERAAVAGRWRSQPEVIHLSDAAQAAHLVDEWRGLARRIEGTSYFQTPDWVLSCWEEKHSPLQIASWRSAEGQLEAVVCLTEARERLHRKLPLSAGAVVNAGSGRPYSADHCGWPSLPHRIADVRRWIASRVNGASLLLRHLDLQTGIPFVPEGARRVLTTPCPRLELDGSGRQISNHFRRHLDGFQRRLDHAGVSFRWMPPEDLTPGALDALFSLHESRCTLRGASSFVRHRVEPFHRRLIERGGRGRGPAMLLAVNGGKAVGVLYGFIWGNTFAYYQGGWDAAWARFSLGTVLVHQAIRFAMLSGAKHFDFLRGAEPYKYRFGATDRIDETWLLPRGYSGWLLNRKYKLISTRRLKAARPLENCDEPTPSPLALAGCPRPTRSLHLTPAV